MWCSGGSRLAVPLLNKEKTAVNTLVGLWTRLLVVLSTRRARDESGQAVSEYLGLAALGIAAIVVIGAAVRVLGVDVIEWIRAQLGV